MYYSISGIGSSNDYYVSMLHVNFNRLKKVTYLLFSKYDSKVLKLFKEVKVTYLLFSKYDSRLLKLSKEVKVTYLLISKYDSRL